VETEFLQATQLAGKNEQLEALGKAMKHEHSHHQWQNHKLHFIFQSFQLLPNKATSKHTGNKNTRIIGLDK
jgi:ABC-type lipoprotein export system ATPase subunit